MNDWSHGYDVSVGYTYGFYREMAPDWLDLCARLAGIVPPPRGGSPAFRYLELGAGQGFGLCLLAAAHPDAEYVGIDFHPDHVAHAQAMADAAGLTNLRFIDADFLALADDWPADLGTFDYVALHGVYTWVPLVVRDAVVRCLAHAVKPGGLVYLSHNAQPGWLGSMPFQHISRLIKETSGAPGDAVFRESIALFDRLKTGGAATFQILPAMKARLGAVKSRSTNYLVSEYLHDGWQPLWHSEVARALRTADLEHAGSATIAETMLPALLPPPLRDAIVAQPAVDLRQDVQDFVINQAFRRDIFVRRPHRSADAQADVAANTRLALAAPPPPGRDVKVETAFGEISLQYVAFAEVVSALAEGAQTMAALAELPVLRRQGATNAIQILLLLVHAGVLALAPIAPAPAGAAHRLNAAIARGAAQGLPYAALAAPAFGAGVAAGDVELLLADAWLTASGTPDADALAAGLATRLDALGRPAHQDGPALARQFLDHTLPRWRALGAIGSRIA